MTKYALEKESINRVVRESFSWRQVLKKLGVNCNAGGNYKTIKKYVAKYGIDCSHFKGRGWNAGGKARNRLDIRKILQKGTDVKSNILKARLIQDGSLNNVCSVCGNNGLWIGKKLVLELDHVDGNRYNNELKNLRLLCPNCHSQTENFRGR